MDFGVLPPEINSARMYSGPGSGPLRAAAAAWDGLATELTTTAASYSSVISELTSQEWLGLSSMSMAAAAAPFAAWMSATAAQAEQAAAQAHAAASAYEAAFTMTVDPAEIVANRIQTMSLIATNILGPKHPGDRSPRSALRRNVGSGHRRDARLCKLLCGRDEADVVHFAAANDQPVRARGPGRDGRQSRRARPNTISRPTRLARPDR